MQRLNVFQSLMRHWERIGPYNAAQVMLLDRAVGVAALLQALPRALREAGVGRLRVEGSCYEHVPADASLSVARSYAGGTLELHLADALNQPFVDVQPPFRPFVVEDGEEIAAGIVYRHWIADSVSIRGLMRRWLKLSCDPRADPEPPAPPLPGGYWRCSGPGRRGWSLMQGLLDQARLSWELKRARRVRGDPDAPPNWSFRLLRPPDGTPDRLRTLAGKLRATVNDVLLASVALALNSELPLDLVRSRPKLALGAIVDLRRACGIDETPFGLLLGFVHSLWRPQDLRDLASAVRAAARSSARARLLGHAQSCQLRMALGLQLFRRWDDARVLRFYRKRLPLAGGISNVNLGGTWVAARHPGVVRDYLRVSPTGPMMPLVFTPTTCGDRLNVGFTWQRQLLSDAGAARIAESFVARIMAASEWSSAEEQPAPG